MDNYFEVFHCQMKPRKGDSIGRREEAKRFFLKIRETKASLYANGNNPVERKWMIG